MSEIPFLARLSSVVLHHGERIALQEPHRRLTYAELLGAIDAEANRLRAGGFRPGSLRRIEQPRSIEFIVEALASWRAGGAFLPLDPATPQERRDSIWREASAVDPGEAAYLIYTSGSTGRPKGVRVGHGGLLPVLDAQIAAFGLAPGKRALWLLSPGFDAALSDIGTALLSGATLCIPPPGLTPRELVRYLASEHITHADLPPSLLPLLGPLPGCMEVLVIGGEVCPPEAVRFHARRLRVLNVYGPTEATICTSLGGCDADTWSRPLLGQPLPHVRYRVRGEQGHEVAEGASGELYIGGVALALGYVAQPALEAERFPVIEGERWYRTGDRVRRLPGGEYEFLGRVDRQLKLRGQLVAPEEIEARLQEHPAVIEAAVLPYPRHRPGRAPRSVLLAFVVTRGGDRIEELREHLRGHLPRALCPLLLPLDALPRGPNGKIDGETLRALAATRPTSKPAVGAGLAAQLCALFEELLGVDGVGEDENFFALGGDSLAALELIAEAELQGIPLPADALYRSPTPATLAAALPSERATVAELLGERPHPPQPPSASLVDVDVDVDVDDPSLAGAAPLPPAVAADAPLFLTGATGFLGSRLLAYLLQKGSKRPIHALVRAPDRLTARRRLAEALGGWGQELPERAVEVWAGDVERPELGLSPGEWRDLCGRVGLVVHGAARVHLLAPFEALRGSNVGGAEQVARVLEEGPAKVLVHISTLSVFAATEHPERRIDEESDPEGAVAVHGGYAQSKWLAEAWLRRRGPHVVIRPGLLTGDEETGRSAPSCQLMHLLRGLAELGCVPRGDHEALRVDVTPVDHAARVIAALLREAPREGVFHVASGRGATLAQLVGALRAEGARCEEVSAEEFLARARARRSPSVSVALLSLGRLLGAGRQATDLFLLTGRELVCERTEAHTGCKAPEVSEGLLRRYVRAARGS